MDSENIQYAIGIDLGATKINLGVVDEKGWIHESIRLATHVNEGAQFIENQILESISYLQKHVKCQLAGIGIGVAGQIHPQTGEVLFAPNLRWHNVSLQSTIERALNLPVCIVNDVRAITWGEWKYGAGKGYHDLVCLFIGTGIGSGIVSGGVLLNGYSNTFGEVGHMSVDFKGPTCTCGNRGCLEVFAGGWGIAVRGQDVIKMDTKGIKSHLLLELAGQDLGALTAQMVIKAYYAGDAIAQQVIEETKKALAAGCASLVNAFNPQAFILGGGIIDGMPELITVIEDGVRQLALRTASQPVKFLKAQLGKEVGVVGSAAAIFNAIKNKNKY